MFHTTLERLSVKDTSDTFVKLAVDLYVIREAQLAGLTGRERWLMEGQYNRVYRAKDRVPRPEFAFLLDRLVSQVRCVGPSAPCSRGS